MKNPPPPSKLTSNWGNFQFNTGRDCNNRSHPIYSLIKFKDYRTGAAQRDSKTYKAQARNGVELNKEDGETVLIIIVTLAVVVAVGRG